MLIHNVFFWLRNDLSEADRATFVAELQKLSQIAYLERGDIGVPAKTESRPVIDHSFDFAASFQFKSMEDHDFYQKGCPEHARFVSACKPLWEKVVIYDIAPMSL